MALLQKNLLAHTLRLIEEAGIWNQFSRCKFLEINKDICYKKISYASISELSEPDKFVKFIGEILISLQKSCYFLLLPTVNYKALKNEDFTKKQKSHLPNFENFINSLGQIIAYLKPFLLSLWYQKWFGPCAIKVIHPAHVLKEGFHSLQHIHLFRYAGMSAIFLTIFASLVFLYQDCQLREETSIDNETKKRRHLERVPFHLNNIGFSTVNFISWFILHASWATPVFIAGAVTFEIQAAYEVGEKILEIKGFIERLNLENKNNKNKQITLMQALFGGSYLDRVSAYNEKSGISPTRDQINKAKLQAHRAELRQKTFLLACATAALVFTIIWLHNPPVAITGLLIITAVAVGGSIWLNHKRAVPAKEKAIRLQKNQNKNNSASFFKDSANDRLSVIKPLEEERVVPHLN